jgi:hypothetical protein
MRNIISVQANIGLTASAGYIPFVLCCHYYNDTRLLPELNTDILYIVYA